MHLKLRIMMKVIAIIGTIFAFSFSVTAAAQQSCSYYGDVRLIGGSNEREGRVEVCIGKVWGTVCHYSWSSNDARVVCRQLGFEVDVPRGYPSAYSYAQYGQGTGPIYLAYVSCTGRESSLLDCQYYRDEIGNVRSCSHYYDAGVRCPPTNCTHGNVRLAGGLGLTEGRVEMCVQERWTGVCHYRWTDQDAFVVCRQLGYPATGTVAYTYSSSRFGRGVDANLTYFYCYGNESHLLNCTHRVTSSCSRDYTAGVLCYGDVVPASPQCYSNGNVRLVGGASSNEGRVEVCVNGMWGTVTYYRWDSREATVVCKQLGYQNPVVYPYISSTTFGAGNGPIFLTHLNCIGNEQTLLDCSSSYPYPYRYSHSSDAWMRCEHRQYQYSGCINGTIQLVGGRSSNEGRVEICINGVWGTVCRNSWGSSDARVVCRQLGLPYTGATNAYFGRGSGLYHLDYVHCSGTESSLLSCSRGSIIGVHNCRPGNEAGVKCASTPSCTHGDVRLVGGETAYEGRVEICLSNSWVSVCDSSWNVQESRVVCRQLTKEANPRSSAIRRAYYIYGRGLRAPSYINYPSCSGLENELLNCSFSASYCSSSYNVGVRCYVNSGCPEGDVRLAGGETAMEGRVEVCQNQTWWAVSGSYYWDYSDATVVCRHLHYPANWAIPLSTALFGRGNATILVQNFGCTGREESLQQCTPNNYSISSYYSRGYYVYNRGPVASVICQGNTTSQPECSSGDLRLVGGERESEGRVEICVEGFWGTVCDSGFGREEATVVCRQLGIKTLGEFATSFGEGSGPVFGGIYCRGTESNLTQCGGGSIGQRDCHHGRDVGVICQDPVVTVVTDPPSGPHLIGSTVNLTCLINPQPSAEGVTYQWRDYIPYTSPVVANSSLPYATLTIGRGHPHTARYYCQVYYRNQLLASGSTVITVQGLLFPIGPTVVQYNTLDTVILQVNITPTATFTRDYLRALTWYHNRVKIIPRSYRYYYHYYYYYTTTSLSSDSTTLTITNARQSAAGVYHVQFAGLRIYPYNKLCEEETLDILRHYPVLSPVVFNVYTDEYPSESNTGECPVNRGYIRATPNSQVLPYTTSDTITINISGNAPTTQRNLVYTRWYFDGSGFPSGISLSSSLRLPTGITQTLRINNPTPLHNGTYEVLLLLNTGSNSYFQQFGCPNAYWNFVYYSSRAGVNPLILDQISFNLQYYEPATVSIQSSRPALQDNECSTLNCTADGGYPPTSSISFIKNGRIISTTNYSDEELVISIAANDTSPFGQYVCLVNNSVTTIKTLFLMKQKGELQAVLDLGSSRQCDSLNNDTQQMLITGIADTIRGMCSCNFTSSDLEESVVTCSTNDNTTMTFTTTVVYSTESGDMTASTLIRMFQDRAASTSTVISVGSQTATIVSVCNPSCTPEPQPSPTSIPESQVEEPSRTVAQELPEEIPCPTVAPELQVEQPSPTITLGPQEVKEPLTSNIATLVGAFLGGLIAGVVICITAAVIVCVLAKRRSVKLKGRTRPMTQTSTKATAAAKNVDMVRYTSESVQISPNAAYEGVTFYDEPIYDQPM